MWATLRCAGRTVLYHSMHSGWSHVTSPPSAPLEARCHRSPSHHPLVTTETYVTNFSAMRGTACPVRYRRYVTHKPCPIRSSANKLLSHVITPSAKHRIIQYMILHSRSHQQTVCCKYKLEGENNNHLSITCRFRHVQVICSSHVTSSTS